MCCLVCELQGERLSFLCDNVHLVMKFSFVNANASKCFCEGYSQAPSLSLPPKRMGNHCPMHVKSYCF